MSSNSSSGETAAPRKWSRLLTLPVWVLAGFVGASLLTLALDWAITTSRLPLPAMSSAVTDTLMTVTVYALTLLIVLGVPWLVRKVPTTYGELGLTRWPSWMDLLWAPVAFIAYLILSGLLRMGAEAVIPWYDVTEVQDVGFQGITMQYELLLAFLCLVVLAPIAEELLFRGYLLGKLRKHVPVWAAVLATSVLFGVVHASWTVGVDVFALSLALCFLRLTTGSIWAPTLLHMLKNGIAFYLLFVNPALLPA